MLRRTLDFWSFVNIVVNFKVRKEWEFLDTLSNRCIDLSRRSLFHPLSYQCFCPCNRS